jgi:post-segregation antitoxin (ccd killing protein)
MAVAKQAVKRSVTIDPEVLDSLIPDRKVNLSATVNEGLQLLAALDAQQAVVDDWEREHGQFTDEELRPYLQTAMQAQVDNAVRLLRETRAARPPRRRHE